MENTLVFSVVQAGTPDANSSSCSLILRNPTGNDIHVLLFSFNHHPFPVVLFEYRGPRWIAYMWRFLRLGCQMSRIRPARLVTNLVVLRYAIPEIPSGVRYTRRGEVTVNTEQLPVHNTATLSRSCSEVSLAAGEDPAEVLILAGGKISDT